MAGTMFQTLAKVEISVNAYAALKAAYNCPESHVLNKFCSWISVADFGKLIVTHNAADTPQKTEEKKAAIQKNEGARDFLHACEACLSGNSALATAVKAGAVARPGTVGEETVTAARRHAAHELRCLHNTAVYSIGRYLCGKPQEDNFGKQEADDLFDIYVFIFGLLEEKFGDTVKPEMLVSLSTWAEAPLSEKKDEKKKDKKKKI